MRYKMKKKKKEFNYVDEVFIPSNYSKKRKPQKKKYTNAKAYIIREINGKDVYIEL